MSMMSVIDEKQHTLGYSDEGFVTPSFEDVILTPEYQFYDISIGCLLVLCSIVGFSGNTFSLLHFLNETPKTLSTKLYIAICFIDIITSTISIPVILVLFNKHSDTFGFRNHIYLFSVLDLNWFEHEAGIVVTLFRIFKF